MNPSTFSILDTFTPYAAVGMLVTVLSVMVSHWIPTDSTSHARTLWMGLATVLIGEVVWLGLAGFGWLFFLMAYATVAGSALIDILCRFPRMRRASRFAVYATGTSLTVAIKTACLFYVGYLQLAPVVLAFGLVAGLADGLSYWFDRMRNRVLLARLYEREHSKNGREKADDGGNKQDRPDSP